MDAITLSATAVVVSIVMPLVMNMFKKNDKLEDSRVNVLEKNVDKLQDEIQEHKIECARKEGQHTAISSRMDTIEKRMDTIDSRTLDIQTMLSDFITSQAKK